MKPKAILFDIDGTILNTHEYIYQAFQHSLSKHDKSLAREELQFIMGKPLEECYRILTSLENVTDLMQTHKQFQLDNPHLAVPFDNTISTLETIHGHGIQIAAVTNRARKSVLETLERSALMPYFDQVVAVEDVVNPKPEPEGIQKILTYFEVDPAHAMMVGDSDVDVIAGKNAGVKTVGVTYGFHREKIKEVEPDFVIEDIKEIISILDKQ